VAETKVALVPSVVIVSRLTQRQYGLVLTDARALFVLQRTLRLPVLWAAMGVGVAAGLLLAAGANVRSTTTILLLILAGVSLALLPARAVMRQRIPDYATMTPDQLAAWSGTLSVPYISIQSVALRKVRTVSSRLTIIYRHQGGSLRELRATLLPDLRWVRARMDAGVNARAAYAEYAGSVRQAVTRALPSELAERVETD